MTTTPMFDRQAIQALFGVKARSANNLMNRLGGYPIGGAHAVSRESLLERLDGLAGTALSAEAERKAKVVDAIDQLRRQAGPRRVKAPDLPPPKRGVSQLPSNVQITAMGEMIIRYASPEEFLGVINAFAQFAVDDYASFADSLQSGPSPANTAL